MAVDAKKSVDNNSTNKLIDKDINKTEVKEVTNKVIKEKKGKPVAPKMGISNRCNYDVHVVFKDFDILLSPGKRTTKIYNEKDLVSVQGLPPALAIAKGMITILR